MGLPKILKHFNVFNDGDSYLGQVMELALPKLELDTQEHRGAGMLAPVDILMGLKKMEMEHKYAGLVVGLLRQFGRADIAGAMLRFTGSYQSDDTGAITAAELVVRGRHVEIDPGKAKAGEPTEWGVKSTLTYLKWTIAGRVEAEIDVLGMIWIMNGVDLLAEHRAAIGA